MKKILLLSFLACFLTIAFTNDAYAQKKKKKTSKTDEYFDESGDFLSKVWYAGGLNLNWGNAFLGGRQGNIFTFGVSPMAGYEFFEGFSVGPRLEFLYQSGRFDNGQSPDLKYNSVDFGIGAFTRYKFQNGLFLHGELQALNEEEPVALTATEVLTSKNWTNNLFVGAGYASGGIVGFEVYVLYNTSEERTAENLPIYYRFGINYKFLQ
jgi:hypothetical protein